MKQVPTLRDIKIASELLDMAEQQRDDSVTEAQFADAQYEIDDLVRKIEQFKKERRLAGKKTGI